MKIKNINIKDFIGIKSFLLDDPAPVILIAGPNGAGKSSIRDAVSFAITEELSRVRYLKESGALIHNGSNDASISIEFEDSVYVCKMAKSEHDNCQADFIPSKKIHPLINYVIDSTKFARDDDDARRKVLFKLSGLNMGISNVKSRLIEKKCDQKTVELVEPYLHLGFEKACEHAKGQARENKGSWRTITGEAYGEKKAETWKAESGDVESLRNQIITGEKLLSETDMEIELLSQKLGSSNSVLTNRSNLKQEIESLASKGNYDRIKKKYDHDLSELEKLTKLVDETERAAHSIREGDIVCKCPSCETELIMTKEHKLIEHGDLRGNEDAVVALPELINSLNVLKRSVENGKRDLDAVIDIKSKVIALQQQLESLPEVTVEMITSLQAQIDGLKSQKSEASKKINVLCDLEKKFSDANRKMELAAEHHALVKNWSLIADLLEPSGIQSDYLNEALTPFNTRLAITSEKVGWRKVSIDERLEIHYGNHPYPLLSESEKWRCDALITEAISFLSGMNFFILDRMDVLDKDSRLKIIKLLAELAKSAELGSVIVLATLRDDQATAVARNFSNYSALWMNNGTAELLRGTA